MIGSMPEYDDAKAPHFFIWVDTNGPYKGPNRSGFDLFAFSITPDGRFLPLGVEGSYYPEEGQSKKYDGDESYKCKMPSGQGWSCAYRAMTEKDYFKNLPR